MFRGFAKSFVVGSISSCICSELVFTTRPLKMLNEAQDHRSRSDRYLTSCWIQTRNQMELQMAWIIGWDQAGVATQASLRVAEIRRRGCLEHILQDCH